MATDQEIRDSGLLYIPKQKYLQNPYNLPVAPETVAPVPGGITNTNAFTNSGGGETRYDNSFLPDLPQFNYVDMVRKYGSDSKQAQQMLTKAGATYPGNFQSNEGGFEYTNSFPDNSIQMENLDNNYLNQGNTFQGKQFNQSIEDEKDMIAQLAAEEANTKTINFTYPNDNRFSTIEGQNNVFDVNVQGDPALNRGSKMAQGDDPYSEKAFEEEEDKQSFIANMISRAKQVGSNLPGWARAAATALGGPFAAAASFLGSGKNYEKFDPRGNIKGGVYTVDGVNYTNLDNVNDFYDDDRSSPTYGTTRFDRAAPNSFASFRTLSAYLNRDKGNDNDNNVTTTTPNTTPNTTTPNTDYEDQSYEGGGGGGFNNDNSTGYDEGNFCFDPKTPIQMADGSTKEIKNIQLGDNTKGGEVTGVFQFKASDEIHDYKGVTVAGSHYVKENGRFIMVKDSPLSVKIDKIPVVYSLDTTGRRIFINDIEFADYNGDGVAKNFLTNAGVNLSGFDKEVLRQVEQRLI